MRREKKRSSCTTAVILVADGLLNAYDLLRSLGMSGITCCVISSDKNDILFSSRYCQRKIVLPPFDRQHDLRILSALIAVAKQCREKPVLFYVSDPGLSFLGKFRKRLEPYYRFLLPPEDCFVALFNKAKFVALAKEKSIPAPASLVCSSLEELYARIDEVPLPCIVKPAFRRHWELGAEELRTRFGFYKRMLRRLESRDELIDFCRALPQMPSEFVVQEYIDGRDEAIHSFHGYFDEQSKCLAHFVGRKIRTWPVHTGGSAYIRTIHRPALAALSIELLQTLHYQGIVKIDFKLDGATNQFKVLEINARYSLWQLLGALAGVNLAEIAYHHQRGEPFTAPKQFLDDVRLLGITRDLRALVTGYLGLGEWTLASYLRSLRGRKHFFFWDPSDPLPVFPRSFGSSKRAIARIFKSVRPAKEKADL